MVRGIDSFRKWFAGFEEQYTIIGGTACDLLMTESSLTFRATKDIDLVLIIEAVTPEFGRRFWEYVTKAGYEHRKSSTGQMQFYRFNKPLSPEYPAMIELFSRRPEGIKLPPEAVLTPMPIDEEISSLSAILLDEEYYAFLKSGRVNVSGVEILDTVHLIPFKARAWMDLTDRAVAGQQISGRDLKKHRNDVFRLYQILPNDDIHVEVPAGVRCDMELFLKKIADERIDLKQLGLAGYTMEEVIDGLREIYLQESGHTG